MPNIIQSFQGRDIGYLRIVARLWGIELAATDTDIVLKELAEALLDPKLGTEIVDSLPADARSALETLAKADGKLPWAAFARRFGEIREVGPGRRDREQIYLHPLSAAEVLFYRALLARAFFDVPAGAQEFAYIPDDFIPLIHHKGHEAHKMEKDKALVSFVPLVVKQGDEPLGRLASPKEREHPLPVSDRLLDDATTLLAALRMGLPPPETRIPVSIVTDFLSAAKIIRPSPRAAWAGGGVPQIEPVRLFLEAPRKDALDKLVNAWLQSGTFNELRQVPSLVCEGEWSNQPLVTREFLLTLFEAVPENIWWSLPAYIRAIKEKYPDFQRPAGDYDTWFIKRLADGVYLRGFSVWDEVDGALIRYLITGPLYWLGQVELATPPGNEIVSAFRVVSNVVRQTSGARRSTVTEMSKLHVSSQGKIVVPRLLPRAARYQIARFCEWDQEKEDEYRYRVTTGSLKKAREQGLKVSQMLSLLAKNAAAEIPPAFVKALKRWETNGTEARVEVQTVLRVSRPEVLEELHKSKAGRFLGETLGPVTVIVKPGAQSKVQGALAELGLLAENLTMTPKELGQADTTPEERGQAEHKGEN